MLILTEILNWWFCGGVKFLEPVDENIVSEKLPTSTGDLKEKYYKGITYSELPTNARTTHTWGFAKKVKVLLHTKYF